jgi:anti-sigma factor RsiW
MNHPKREEWMPLLCGEADGETKRRLEAHLASCGECAAQVQAWRRTMGRLDAWKLPPARRVRAFPMQPVAWAAAAAIVLGAFVAGRFTAPGFDAQKLRAELKSELSAEIQQGFAHAAESSATALAGLETRLAAATTRHQKEMAAQFVEYIAAACAKPC